MEEHGNSQDMTEDATERLDATDVPARTEAILQMVRKQLPEEFACEHTKC